MASHLTLFDNFIRHVEAFFTMVGLWGSVVICDLLWRIGGKEHLQSVSCRVQRRRKCVPTKSAPPGSWNNFSKICLKRIVHLYPHATAVANTTAAMEMEWRKAQLYATAWRRSEEPEATRGGWKFQREVWARDTARCARGQVDVDNALVQRRADTLNG